MIRYIFKRIIWLIPVIIVVSFIVFALFELAPGNMIDAVSSESITQEVRAELITRYNLDKPMLYRYGLYMINLVQGNLGVSDLTGANVWDTFINRLPNTLLLSFSSLLISVVISIPLGIIAARRAGTIIDNSVTVFALLGMSMPLFWLGLLLLLIFSLQLGWLPAGANDLGIRSLILPAVCSSFALISATTRQTRSNMLEVLKADYLRTARAKGTSEKLVIRKHALGNAWIPIITQIGTGLSVQLAGSVVVESVFAWPGIGRMAAEAVRARDVTTATGVVIMTTILFVIVQLIIDVLYAFIDPRIKSQYISVTGKRKLSPAKMKPSKPIAQQTKDTEDIDIENLINDEPAESVGYRQVIDAIESIETEVENPTAPEYKAKSISPVNTQKNTNESKLVDHGKLTTKVYKKRSQLGEIFHSLKRNKGAMVGFIIIILLILIFIASLPISLDTVTAMKVTQRFAPASWQLPFGGDNFGRDMFLRVIYGTRYTLAIGFGAVALAAIFGITFGAIAGFYGGRTENYIMRASDVLASIPGILLGMVIVTVLGQNLQNLIIAVAVQSIPVYLRMTRASIMTVKNNEFVEAAHAIGYSNFRIIFTQVLPNGLSPIIVTITSSLGVSIIVASSLSYLGFGIPAPYPEWGALIAVSKEYARGSPQLMTYPGIFIMITVLAFNLLGDGLRDALDPKLKR